MVISNVVRLKAAIQIFHLIFPEGNTLKAIAFMNIFYPHLETPLGILYYALVLFRFRSIIYPYMLTSIINRKRRQIDLLIEEFDDEEEPSEPPPTPQINSNPPPYQNIPTLDLNPMCNFSDQIILHRSDSFDDVETCSSRSVSSTSSFLIVNSSQ